MTYDCADFVQDITGQMTELKLVDYGTEEDLAKQSEWTADAILKLAGERAELLNALSNLMGYVGGWDQKADHPCGAARDVLKKHGLA